MSRLGLPAVKELVKAIAAAGVALPSDAEERLYRDSEGIPFFLVEYLTTLKGDADTGADEWAMPTSVRHLLQSRLGSVTEIGRQLMDTAAVIGRSFDLETLQRASGRGDEEAVVALEALIDRGVVNETRGREGAGAVTTTSATSTCGQWCTEETSLARRRLCIVESPRRWEPDGED